MATQNVPEHALGNCNDVNVAVEQLSSGNLEVLGRMPWSSNMTFLVDILHSENNQTLSAPQGEVHSDHDAGGQLQGIYKPLRGERPLWDFPAGLHKRETAAFHLSQTLGWNLVPPTVLRDGPFGEGSLQLFVPARYEEHYFTLFENTAYEKWFQRLCAYDFIINSTDRKAGHILLSNNGKLYAIDNGLSFHTEFKLRTVIWDWAGQPLPAELTKDISELLDKDLPSDVTELLSPAECEALLHRSKVLLDDGHFPEDPSGQRHPWPLV